MIFALLFGCSIQLGSGVSATRTLSPASFTGIDNSTQVAVSWSSAEAPAAALTCDDNLLDVYEVTVKDGTLVLSTPIGVAPSPKTDCELVLSSVCLSEISGSGSGDIYASASSCGLQEITNSGSAGIVAEAVDTSALRIDLSGSGGVEIDGVAGDVEIRTSGSGGVQGRSLSVGVAEVNMSSSADVHLAVTDLLDAQLSGSGDLYVYGSPGQESVRASGSGEVFFR